MNFAMRYSPEAPLVVEQLSCHLPASNSAAALQADLEHLKVTLKAELRAELKAELLAELREKKPAAARLYTGQRSILVVHRRGLGACAGGVW